MLGALPHPKMAKKMHSFLKWEDNLSQLSSIVCTLLYWSHAANWIRNYYYRVWNMVRRRKMVLPTAAWTQSTKRERTTQEWLTQAPNFYILQWYNLHNAERRYFLPIFVSRHVLLYSKSVRMEDEVALDIRAVLGFNHSIQPQVCLIMRVF